MWGASSNILFKEDFEDGNLDGWGVGPNSGAYAVTGTTAANGTSKSLWTTKTQFSPAFGGPNYQWPNGITPSRVTFWLYFPATISDVPLVALSGDANAADHFVQAGIYSSAVNGCGPAPGAPPFVPAWYFFDINFTWNAARTSASWVCTLNGGDPRYGGFGTADSAIRRIDIYDAAAAGPGAGWDELVIYK